MNLADAVLRLAPLEGQLATAIGIPAGVAGAQLPGGAAADTALLDALFVAAGMRAPRRIAADAAQDELERVALRLLAGRAAPPADAHPAHHAIAAIAAARTRGLDGVAIRHTVGAPDGVRLSAVHAGLARDAHPVLLIGAPGMPLELIEGWLRGISEVRPVASWETRGMFGPDSASVRNLTIDDQLGDAAAILDEAGWDDAHVLGICGGAVLAMALAARHPHRVRSLALWFGDLDLGEAAPKTEHQRNLQALMEMVVSRQVSAQSLRAVLIGFMAKLSDAELAPLVLYPFANPQLLDQYCRMNHPIMATDCRIYVDRIVAPCLIGYGPDDTTTHPEGSRVLAALLDAPLVAMPAATHLDSLRGRAQDLASVLSFQRSHDSPPG
ncbi:hypothetical protein GCM10027093_27040 [Paraburkholderia jirisanensis]